VQPEEEIQLTAARQISHLGAPATFLVWVTRAEGPTAVLTIEAADSDAAKRKALAEFLHAEAVLSAL
jgi:alkylation response protein AidB-like acyl-CoA dehydrogenase